MKGAWGWRGFAAWAFAGGLLAFSLPWLVAGLALVLLGVLAYAAGRRRRAGPAAR